MPVIDLHSHSRYSDGALSPAELVARAHARGVTALALTDHDSVRGVAEAMAAGRELGVELIPAVELSAIWRHWTVHLVGLQLDIDEPGLKAALHLQAGARGLRAQQIAQRFDKLGIAGSYAAVLALAGDPDSISRTHFAQWLLAQGRVNTMQQAFDRYLGQGKPADVPLPWMPLADAVAVIRAAGGHAVLAHPGRYDMTRTKLRELLTTFKAAGGVGMEVATATEKPDIVRYLGQLSTQFDLYASQGSDFHGAHMPWIELGRFPELPAGCKPVWQLWQPQLEAI
jgi:predicted metal-dependent phosphoesterase TrpH